MENAQYKFASESVTKLIRTYGPNSCSPGYNFVSFVPIRADFIDLTPLPSALLEFEISTKSWLSATAKLTRIEFSIVKLF